MLIPCDVTLGENKQSQSSESDTQYPVFNFDFTVTDPITSKDIHLSKYNNRNLLISFVHLGIVSARAQILTNERIRDYFLKDELTIICINFHRRTSNKLALFLSNRQLNYPIFDGEAWQQLAFGNIKIFPTTLLINSDNLICERMEGYRSFEFVVNAIADKLKINTKQKKSIQPADK